MKMCPVGAELLHTDRQTDVPRIRDTFRSFPKAPEMGWGPLMVAQRLGYCATNRKVAGSIPDDVTEIFYSHNPSDRTMALGVDSTSNRNEYQEHFLGVKAAGA
jgi:hypothetical protein